MNGGREDLRAFSVHRQHSGARTVAPQNARRAIRPIECAAHHFRRHHEDAPAGAVRQILFCHIESEDETGARGRNVEAPCLWGVELCLEPVCGGGTTRVRRDRRDDDEIECVGTDPRTVQRRASGFEAQIGRGDVWRGNPAFPHPGPSHDPLVGGVQPPRRQVLIGEHLRRDV